MEEAGARSVGLQAPLIYLRVAYLRRLGLLLMYLFRDKTNITIKTIQNIIYVFLIRWQVHCVFLI